MLLPGTGQLQWVYRTLNRSSQTREVTLNAEDSRRPSTLSSLGNFLIGVIGIFERRADTLVDVASNIMFTVRCILLRHKLVSMPDEIDIQSRYKE